MCLLRSMTLGIRRDFHYTRRTEKGVHSPGETLTSRCGSCRDFAVLMIEATRSLGLAARFVSGYIYVPGLDSGLINGAGATHAWIQAYLPGDGWIDFDPTNRIVGNRNLIRVAVAWTPDQGLPLLCSYPCLDTSPPSRGRLDRFRPDESNRGQSQSDSRGGGVDSGPSLAAVGHLLRASGSLSANGSHGSGIRIPL